MMHQRGLGSLAALLAVGCGGLVDVERTGFQPLEPLPVYADWWAETEACSGRTGDLDRIEWWQAITIVVNQAIVLGQWEAPHRITILSFHVGNSEVVRHEMLHDLLGGDPDHTDASWDACGVRTVTG